MWLEIFLCLLTLFILLYRYITKRFDHFEKLGLPYVKPSFPFGSHNLVGRKKHFNDYMYEDYVKYKDEKMFGLFLFGKPFIVIKDVDMIKTIKVKDFNHFTDTQDEHTVKIMKTGGDLDRLFNNHVGNAKGDHWKDIRATFSPIFTSGKMKAMMHLLITVTEALTGELGKKAEGKTEFETKEVFGKFSLDALASCAFGIDGQSFEDPNAPFVKHAQDIFAQGLDTLLVILKFIPPVAQILQALNISIQKPKAVKFFKSVVLQNLQKRRESGVRRNDLIDMMLDCIKEEEGADEEEEEEMEQYHQDMKLQHKKVRKLDELAIVSNAIILLVVGYDTTGMTLAYLAYELSRNPEVQAKLQEEVDRAFEEAAGSFPSYTVVQGLPYVDMVVHEVLRLHTPAPTTARSCTQDYTIPDTNISLKKNDSIVFCGKGFHRDPKFYSHPEEFYPDHFGKEEKATRSPHAFQAFGQGPRACLGMRFALLEAKVAILATMRRFTFLPGTSTQLPLVADPKAALNYPQGGLWVKVEERREA